MTTIQLPHSVAKRAKISTESDSESSSAGVAGVSAERETASRTPRSLQSVITQGNRLWEASRAYWSPPALLSVQPPTMETLADYARSAAYTSRVGPVRAAGIAWCYLVAAPALIASRLWAWTLERPGRLLTVAVTTKLLSYTPPLQWATENLVKPTIDAAVWLLI